MSIKLYIANLGKYTEGELVGSWFTCPIDMEEVSEQIGLNERYEEYAIHDYEAPFSIGEYDNIEELNEISERLESLDEEQVKALGSILDYGCASDINEAIDMIENGEVYFYHDCFNMKDVAYEVIDQTGMLSQVPNHIANYFDYESYGRDLEIEGTFIYLGLGTYIEVVR